jgi:hypothetical protein
VKHRKVPRWVGAAMQPDSGTTHADEFGGNLSDYKHERLRIACGPCGRDGDYRVKTLRTMLGNPAMNEVPRFLAMKAGCALAARYPGHECRAYFVDNHNAARAHYLSDACAAGWALTLKCERRREGLKSVRACRFQPFGLDLESLVSALGHDFPIEQLPTRLVCPGCGSHHFALAWIAPKAPPAEPIPITHTRA